MSKQQTAVEWLEEQFEESHSYINEIFKEVLEQAKAMEKEQIIKANEDASTNELGEFLNGKQYYNETFKSE